MIGKWAIINEEEYYQTGEIVALVDDNFVLVRMTTNDKIPPFMSLFALVGMLDGDCQFFNSDAEMKNWLIWADTPSSDEDKKPRIVNFKKGEQK